MIESTYIVDCKKKRKRYKNAGSKPLTLVDPETGEIVSSEIELSEPQWVDEEEFVKVFDWQRLMGMSMESLRVLFYLLGGMSYGGVSKFTYKKCMDATGYRSVTSIQRGLVQLAKLDIIRPRKRGEYWINPNFAFKGQRKV